MAGFVTVLLCSNLIGPAKVCRIELPLALPVIGTALVFGIVFGLNAWHDAVASGVAATAGTVMLASLPTIIGMQMTLSAIHFDIGNEPRTPLKNLLGGNGGAR